MYKQVIVVNTSLSMGTGKTAAQVAHASLGSYDRARHTDPGAVEKWRDEGQKKVVVKGLDADHLRDLRRTAEVKSVPCYLVEDAGLTQLEPGSVTALAVGPAAERDVDPITGDLKLL